MRVFLNVALCKKCPFSVFKMCHYKRNLYKKVPKVESKVKMIHNCTFYKKIFKKGQYVLVDLNNQVPSADGKWSYVPAHKDVPGIIKGTRGNKFIVELFEPFFLIRKKKGRPHTSRLKVFLQCTRVAKDIRPFRLKEHSFKPLKTLTQKPQAMN